MPAQLKPSWPRLAELGVFTAIALAVRLAHLESATPWYDDFFHLLAARGWLAEGSFSIGPGEYNRAALFTRLVAESLRLFGDTLAAGRVPAVAAGTLWCLAVFVWTRRVAGRGAAWTAGLLFALDPGAIHLSQWVRFYTLHGLLVWIGATSAYQLVTGPVRPRRAALLGALTAACFVVATWLVETALIALAGAAVWAGAVLLPRLVRPVTLESRRLRWAASGGVVLCLAAGIWLLTSGTAAAYWDVYHTAPYWDEARTAGYRWYFWWFAERYPTLWTLFPIAIPVAVLGFTRPAIFSLWMFASAFVLVSFGGAKAERYLYFAIPFFFVIWGMALVRLVPALRALAARALGVAGGPRWSPRAVSVASWSFTAAVAVFVASQNEAPRRTLRMLFPGSGERPYREADWVPALPVLRPLVDSADVVVSSYLLKPIYYLGRGDVHLSWSETAESGFANGRPIEFSIDPRTGRPGISTPASLQRIMSCFESGLVLVEQFHLNRAHMVPGETSAFLLASTTEIPLPPETWVRAFRWRHAVPRDQPGCPPWRASGNPARVGLLVPQTGGSIPPRHD